MRFFTFQYIDYESIVLSYVFYVFSTMCLVVAALFVLTVSTVTNVCGPTMALKGSTDDSVKTDDDHPDPGAAGGRRGHLFALPGSLSAQ